VSAADKTSNKIRRASREASVDPFGLLQRWIGFRLWALAEAESLPVPPLDYDDGVARRRDAAPAALRWAVLIGSSVAILTATALFGAGFAARARMGELSDRHLFPKGVPMEETAAQLESATSGAWWRPLVPALEGRLRATAARVRANQEPLRRARLAYQSAAIQLGEVGPAGRLVRGPTVVAPLRDALLAVDTPWHRGSLSYQAMATAARPYIEGSRKAPAPIRGVVTAVWADHAVAISVVSRGGGDIGRTQGPLTPGSRFDLAVGDGYVVRVTDLLVRGGAVQVVDTIEIPLVGWRGGSISFPRSGSTARLEFDPSVDRLAPPFPPLSSTVLAELGR